MDISIKFDLEKDLPRNSEDKFAKVMISTMLLREVAPDLDPTIFDIPESAIEKNRLFEKIDGILDAIMKGVGENIRAGSGHRWKRVENSELTCRESPTGPISDISFKMESNIRASNPDKWDCFDVTGLRLGVTGALLCRVEYTKR
jgi:hypothetical protein